MRPGTVIAGPLADTLRAGHLGQDVLDWLKTNFNKTELELGQCLCLLQEGPCECDLCLTCAKFVTTLQYEPRLRERLCLGRQLADDAHERRWSREVERHGGPSRGSRRFSMTWASRTEMTNDIDGPRGLAASGKEPPMRSASKRHLFAGSRLSEALAFAAWSATDKLATWPPDDLLNTAEADVTEQLVELAAIEVPFLARGEARLEPSREVMVKARDFGRQFNVTVTRFTLVVPVTGASSTFGMTASRIAGSVVPGVIDDFEGVLRLHCDNPDNPAQARAYFERTLDQIEQRLKWTRTDIQAHNQQVAKQLPAAVAQRRAKLLSDRDLQASIGYPIVKRLDADSHSVPVKRRTITPARPTRPSGHLESPSSRNPPSMRPTTRRSWLSCGTPATPWSVAPA